MKRVIATKLAAGLGLVLLATTAPLAADLSSPLPPPTQEYAAPQYVGPADDWSGFYAGVVGGYGFGTTSTDIGGNTTDIDQNGGIAGVTAGYNAQVDSMVFGVESDLLWSDQSGNTTCTGGTEGCYADFNWTGSLRARAGYSFDPVLVYATGGLAAAGVNVNVDPATAGTSGAHSDTYLGWTVGGGIEAKVSEALSAKAEYTYADYGTITSPANSIGAGENDISVTSHAVKFGLNYHF